MQAKPFTFLRCTGLATGMMLALVEARAAGLTDAFPASESYIKISGQAPAVSGSDTAFQRRAQQSTDGGLGIEDLHFTKDVNKTTALTVDGRALTGSEDYLLKLNLAKSDTGAVEVGYKRFRTFYDGIGGFFPRNGTWLPLNPQDLHVDRGQFWAEAKWARENQPEFTLRYTNATRTGRKDDTIWGDTDFTGLPNNVPPISQVRKLVPSFRDLNERHQTLEATLKHHVGKTTYLVTLTGDSTNDLDTRYGTRFPGEAKPFPAPAATVLVPAANMNNQITYSQSDGMKTKTFGAMAKTETELTEKITIETGLRYELLHSDFTGDRPLLTTTPTAVGNVILPSNNYQNLVGASKVKVYTGTLAFTVKPVKDFSAKLALKGEDEYVKGAGTFTSVASTVNTTTGAVTITNTPNAENSRLKEKALTPAVDLNYTATKDLALYASATQRFVNGDERYAAPYSSATSSVPPVANLAVNDTSRDNAKFALGATWRHSLAFTLRGEVYYKDNTTKFIGYDVDAGSNYILASQFAGVKVTATARLNPALSCTTRYVYQQGKAQVTGYLPTYPEYDSMDLKNHQISETVDWTPNAQFYFQANASVVFNTISTIYPRAGIAPAAGTSIAWDVNGVLHNADNNYITTSLLAGAVVTKRDDLQFQVFYYRASNFNASLSSLTMPYGAGARDFSGTLGMKHKFTDRLLGNAKIGYIDSKSDTTGGHTNFHGPLAYVSLEIAL